MSLRDLFARLWEAAGATKFGLLGAILFVIVDPPPTRRGAGRLVLIGFIIFSIGAITGARWGNPQAENFAAIAGGFLGGVLAPRLLDWARAATISGLLAALGRTAPRPPPGALPPDPPTSMTTEPTLRDLLGKPMIVLSGYRSPEHNRRVGGAVAASKHMDGTAFDIAMANHDPVAFEEAARKVGILGFGFYPRSGFIHIDLGPARTWGKRFPPV